MKKFLIPLMIILCFCTIGFFGCKNKLNQGELIIYSTEIEIKVGEEQQIKYEYTGDYDVIFETQNSDIVSITDDGVVTGKEPGTAFINVSAGENSHMVSVKVGENTASISLDKTYFNIVKNSEQYITANVVVGGELINSGITWETSSNDLSVKSDGCFATIKSAKTGYYIVTASYLGKSVSCTVKVIEPNARELACPIVTVKDCDTLVWQPIDGANGYDVSINNGEVQFVTEHTYSVESLSDVLKEGETFEVSIRAVAKNDFSLIDGDSTFLSVAHDYILENADSIKCMEQSTVKYICEICARSYTVENHVKDHSFADGVCIACGELQSAGITYEYDSNSDSYYVKVANSSSIEAVVYVAGTYDDGVNGVKSVTRIAESAFSGNKIIEKVYLPESVDTIDKNAFELCTNLRFISMPGVKLIDDSGYNQFLGDTLLTTVIVPEGFTVKTQAFNDYYATNYTPCMDIYVLGSGSISCKRTSTNTMVSERVYFYDETGTACNSWKFGKDGSVVVNYSHSYTKVDGNVQCVKCGQYYDETYRYSYDDNIGAYVVDGFVDGVSLKVVDGILEEYNDGLHGVKPVKKINRVAFQNNHDITRVVLPECIDSIGNSCFEGCSNLYYFQATGLIENVYAEDGGNQFLNCLKLSTVVLGPSFTSNCQMFMSWPNPAQQKVTDIYLYSKDGSFSADGNQDLLTGNIYYYDQGGLCGTWKFNDAKNDIIVASGHEMTNDVCGKCGYIETHGINYIYDSASNSYHVASCTEAIETVVIRSDYNDGVHGLLDVTAVAKRAFRQNLSIKKVILPKTITTIYNAAFSGCTNLVYVDASGVSGVKSYGDTNGDAWFNGCVNLETVIFGDNLDISGNASVFNTEVIPTTPKLDICFSSSEGTLVLNSYSNNLLSGKVYVYDATGNTCGSWKYTDSTKTSIVKNNNVHEYEDGACKHCDGAQTLGLKYFYDQDLNGYVLGDENTSNRVSGHELDTCFDRNVSDIYVRAKYDDGVNGEKDVVAIGRRAFRNNTYIKRVYLPSTVKTIYNAAFSGCKKLEYVDASGVSGIIAYGDSDGDGWFANCCSLRVIILGENLDVSGNANVFNMDNAPLKPVLDVLLSSSNGELKLPSGYPNNLLSGEIYHFDATDEGCGTWKYNQGKTDVVIKKHNYSNGACEYCDEDQTKGLSYYYSSDLNGYVVGLKDLGLTSGADITNAYNGTAKEVYVRAKYNDGTNGEHDVVAVGRRTFRNNTNIERVYLPSTVKSIYNGAFSGCTNLTYVDASGVSGVKAYSDYGDAWFANCTNLKTIIFGASLDLSGNANVFNTGTAPTTPMLDIFLSSAEGELKLPSSSSYANNLLSGNVYNYDESGACGTWKYREDGKGIIVRVKHNHDAGVCEYANSGALRITAWGDSITYGEGVSKDDAERIANRYTSLLSNLLPLNAGNVVVNEGLGGRKLIDAGVVDSIIASADTSDILIVALGANDFAGAYGGKYGENAGLGQITDTDYANAESKTYYGALNALKAAFDQKDVKVVFLAPLGVRGGNSSQHGGTIKAFGDAIREVFGDNGDKYQVVDGLSIVSVQEIEKYSNDGIHVNAEAHELIAAELYSALAVHFGFVIR